MNNNNNYQRLVHNEQWATMTMHNELQWQCTMQTITILQWQCTMQTTIRIQNLTKHNDYDEQCIKWITTTMHNDYNEQWTMNNDNEQQ